MKNEFSQPRGRVFPSRKVGGRPVRSVFLIVCEGEKTEPNYFQSFPVPKSVREVHGVGANTLSLVQEAERLNAQGQYDQVWCVFDRDDFPPLNFNAALRRAAHLGFHVAYSNQAFELWYLLHFHFYNSAVERHQYIEKLDKLLGHPYKKNSLTTYDELLGKQAHAIRYAKRLLENYEPSRPEQDDPSTTVHLLVEELNKHLPGSP